MYYKPVGKKTMWKTEEALGNRYRSKTLSLKADIMMAMISEDDHRLYSDRNIVIFTQPTMAVYDRISAFLFRITLMVVL